MATYVGASWASTGWFGVMLRDDGSWETDHFPTIWSLWKAHSDATRICIDVPIGLPTERKRTCDMKARRLLNERGRAVVYTPVRAAVYEQTLEDAKAITERAGYSIQNQAWSLVPRMRAVDEFLDMNPGARDRLAETHPELCFYALNGRATVPPETAPEGVDRRLAVLAEEHEAARRIVAHAREQYLQPTYASFLRDQATILDALVLAVTARRDQDALSVLPVRESVPRDERGLPMRMIYPRDTTQLRLSAAAADAGSGE